MPSIPPLVASLRAHAALYAFTFMALAHYTYRVVLPYLVLPCLSALFTATPFIFACSPLRFCTTTLYSPSFSGIHARDLTRAFAYPLVVPLCLHACSVYAF